MRALAFLTILASATAQTPEASPQFEVASVKPAPPPTGRGMRVSERGGPGSDDPGFFRCENCSLAGLLETAFDILDYQLTGPDWLRNTRFDVSAKIAAGTTKAQYQMMFQNLLVERFKMTFHRDKKEMPILNLVVMKNGPKFKESKTPEPAPDDDHRNSGPLKKDADGFPILPPGKGMMAMMANGRSAMRSDEETMQALAASLAGQLRQPVIDATGLNGKYAIAMFWVSGDSPDSPGPTIYNALQEQLGLKLESKKGSVDIVSSTIWKRPPPKTRYTRPWSAARVCGAAPCAATDKRSDMRTAALVMIAASIAAAQQFEVASIKPSAPGRVNGGGISGGPGTKDPGLFICDNARLLDMVLRAFDLPFYRFSGPSWLRDARFDLNARIPEGTTREQFRLMQQNLLIERFKLTFHHDQKQLDAYDLVAAKGGPKIKAAEPPPPADGPKPLASPARKLDKDGFPILPPGRQWTTDMEGPRWVQRFTDASMERFAGYLASIVSRPVRDATGLQGKYDFVLKWINDRGRPSTDDSGPNIFEALQTQLGLKLESKKEMIDILIVDHIDKIPTDN